MIFPEDTDSKVTGDKVYTFQGQVGADACFIKTHTKLMTLVLHYVDHEMVWFRYLVILALVGLRL